MEKQAWEIYGPDWKWLTSLLLEYWLQLITSKGSLGVVVYLVLDERRMDSKKDSQQSLVVIVHNIIHTKKHTLIKGCTAS